ncbi:MAG: phosphotransferase [Oscillospiraceae bacterium]|jgi:Ser/Thr protein kinase RdoA (MazF antagonist)|nr:phosphotransferase [Oscillospiraceae bacterium]
MDNSTILHILSDNYPIEIESIEFLRAGGCDTYIVFGKDKKYLLKIISDTFMDTIQQSVDIIRYLELHEFPVPKIINTAVGQPTLKVINEDTTNLLIMYEFIYGEEPDINERAKDIGELVGKLHSIMQNYSGKLTFRRKPFFIDRYINIINAKGYPKNGIQKYIELGNKFWGSVENLPYGYCHGDLHPGNLLITPEKKIYILDFDTSCYAPRMFDIMVMCDTTNYFEFDPNGIKDTTVTFNQFLEGYLKYISLSELERKSFYDFIAIRHYQLQATILEIFGSNCVDNNFIDKQLCWLQNWRKQYAEKYN